MKDYKNLIVWQKAHMLTLAVYKISMLFPTEEKFGLASQIRRASSSITINISEGCGYDSIKEFVRFLQIASGSANETEYLLQLSKDLGYINDIDYGNLFDLITEIKKMLYSLKQKSTQISNR